VRNQTQQQDNELGGADPLEGLTMDERIENHETRITALEKNYADLTNKMQAVETGQLRIEKTLLVEGKEQKKLINQQREEQQELLNRLLEHTLNIRKITAIKKWDLALALFGAGGLIYAVISLLEKFL
ncbi:hypothetical protein BIFPSEUDO_04511, partial [Bifidobacterium pseudocatenulatum DSM 20438 = JCM 1200 = LMG 10505]